MGWFTSRNRIGWIGYTLTSPVFNLRWKAAVGWGGEQWASTEIQQATERRDENSGGELLPEFVPNSFGNVDYGSVAEYRRE